MRRIILMLTAVALTVAMVALSAVPAHAVGFILLPESEDYAIRPPAEDADVLMDLFNQSGTFYGSDALEP